jgi:hypothetical protein
MFGWPPEWARVEESWRQNFQRTSTTSTRQIKSRTLLMNFFFFFSLEKGGGGRIDDVVRYILVCCWRFKQKSEAGCFLVCCWILFYVQYTWCTDTHNHFIFQVNNIIRTFHEYRNKVWSLILSVAERNIIKITVSIKKYNTNCVPPQKKGYIRPKNNTCLGTKTFLWVITTPFFFNIHNFRCVLFKPDFLWYFFQLYRKN